MLLLAYHVSTDEETDVSESAQASLHKLESDITINIFGKATSDHYVTHLLNSELTNALYTNM